MGAGVFILLLFRSRPCLSRHFVGVVHFCEMLWAYTCIGQKMFAHSLVPFYLSSTRAKYLTLCNLTPYHPSTSSTTPLHHPPPLYLLPSHSISHLNPSPAFPHLLPLHLPPHLTSHPIPPHLTSPHLTSPPTSPHLTSPHLTSHLPSHLPSHLTSPHLTSPHHTSPHLTSPHLASQLTSPHLT